MRTIRVAIAYRVLQEWRAPVFAKLAKSEDITLKVFYGEDFPGTKVVSTSLPVDFDSQKLRTTRLRARTPYGSAHFPIHHNLYSELRGFGPDVIICEGPSNFVNNIVCFLYAKSHRRALVQWGLGEIEGRKRSAHRKILDLVFAPVERFSDGAIAYSSFGAKYYIRRGIREDRVFTAVNVVDTESRLANFKEYCARNGLPYPSPLPDRFCLLFVGALTAGKRVDVLLHAFARLLHFRPKAGAHHKILHPDGPDPCGR